MRLRQVEKAFAGRANVEGQRVLYSTDQEKTAIADINPFVTESLGWHVQIRSLLGAFAEEMSRPLERDDDKTHYPCQKLAEFIRENGYDGIRYPSAVCPGGTNVVLFDTNIADVTDPRLARVTELTLEYEVEETAAHETRLMRRPKRQAQKKRRRANGSA